MRTIGLGYGLIVTVLLPIAFLLFKVLRFDQTVSAIFLLSGLWAFIFGLMMERKEERLYYSGFGVIVALLSTPILIPYTYTAGLILVAIVALALIQQVFRPGAPPRPAKL